MDDINHTRQLCLTLTCPCVASRLQGLGITLFGMAYMFVHDGLVHRRFPVGPIENVPYFRRVAAAHQVMSGPVSYPTATNSSPSPAGICLLTALCCRCLQIHHMDNFQGVPYGLFLGPKVCFALLWIQLN